MKSPLFGMRTRDGFTMVELLIVIVIAGVVGGLAARNVGRTISESRLQRAASVIATDLRLGHSMAARQRTPVRISIDTAGKIFRIRDYTTPATVYSERHFGAAGEYPVESLSASDTSLVVYPNGLAAGSLVVTVRTAGRNRVVSMSRTGQVRVSAP